MREFSLRFFDEPFELIGVFRGVQIRLIKRFSTTVYGVNDNTKVLVYGLTSGHGHLYQGSCHLFKQRVADSDQSNLCIELILETSYITGFVTSWRVVCIIWYQSFGSSLRFIYPLIFFLIFLVFIFRILVYLSY